MKIKIDRQLKIKMLSAIERGYFETDDIPELKSLNYFEDVLKKVNTVKTNEHED